MPPRTSAEPPILTSADRPTALVRAAERVTAAIPRPPEWRPQHGFTHPLVATEPNKFGWGAEGERIRVKPTVDLVARGLTGHALALARTLQQNGAYIGDNSGSSTQLELSQAARHSGTNLSTDVFRGRLSWADFEVVTRGWQ